MLLQKGIDVSYWQGDIDWNKVKESGVSFAIIRACAGMKRDKNFIKNITSAINTGIHCGVYIYSYAVTPKQAKEEAEFLLKLIRKYNISYPVFYDIEDTVQQRLTKEERTALITSFCDKILENNYIPGVYSSTGWFNNNFDLNKLKKYEKWVAHWNVKQPKFDGAYGMWQYSSTGNVSGIAGNVDLDYCYRDYTKYAQNYKLGTKIVLENTNLYTSSITNKSSAKITGTYYIYDGKVYNNRLRITNQKKRINLPPVSQNTTGYVTLADIRKNN